MKTSIAGIAVFVAALVLQSGSVWAQNLAANPGFETGDTTGWEAFGPPTISAETSVVHSGNYAGLVADRTDTWNGIAQSFLGVLQPGQTYNVSVWIQLVSDSSQTVQFTAEQIDGNGTTYTAVTAGSVSAGTWTQLAGQFTLNVSGTLTNLTFYLEVPTSATVSYYVDDLQVASPPTNGISLVDAGNVFQRIDGFGASSAWQSFWTTAQESMFYSTASGNGTANNGSSFSYNGIGLSLLRSRIAPGGTTVENTIMQAAQANGARVWSTPWSPAANFKSNGNVNGGNFVSSTNNYQSYASQLAAYVVNMKRTYGVTIYALSVQNEPDAQVSTYESCNWSAQQIHDFIPYLHNALLASNVAATKIILPESQNWQDYSNLAVTAMMDSATSNLVSIVADHNYDGASGPASLVKNSYGKALWETEVALLSGSDSSITNGIYYAGRIHLFLTSAQVNAWHYWWLMPGGSAGNEGLTDTNGVPAKRMYALGQFSRFVRPNYYRIGVSGPSPLEISAYKDSVSPHFALVAINSGAAPISQVFTLTNFNAVGVVTPWITSSSQSLAVQTAVAVTNQTFSYVVPAMSIVTFVGSALTNTPPVLAAVAPQTINAGMTLLLTNIVTDTNLPAPALTFSLLNAPTNALLNVGNGVFTWRPAVSQAGSVNPVSVEVTAGGQYSLSATNAFAVSVNPISQPVLGSVQFAAGQFSVAVTGPSGPDYTLLLSTNLATWQKIYTAASPVLPVTLVDTNSVGGPDRFYRVQIGP